MVDFLAIAKEKIRGRSPDKAAEVIRSVLTAGSDYEQWLHRDLLLAGWCLTQAPAGLKEVDPALVDEVLDRLVAIQLNDSFCVPSEVMHQIEFIFYEFAANPLRGDIWARFKDSTDTIEPYKLLLFQEILQNNQSFSDALLCLLMHEVAELADCAPYLITTNWEKIQSERLEKVLLQLLEHPREHLQIRAIQFLGRFNPLSEEVAETLIPFLHQRRYFSWACWALGKSGKASDKVIDALLDAFSAYQQNKYWTERQAIVEALGQLGNSDIKVIRALKEAVQQNYTFLQAAAAKSLILLGRGRAIAIELLPLMQKNDQEIRFAITYALGELGNADEPIINSLQIALLDPEPDVRCNAANSLEKLGVVTRSILENLMIASEDENEYVRASVVAALWRLDANSDLVLDRLLAMSQDSSSSVRDTIIRILSQFQTRHDDAECALVNLMNDKDDWVRGQAIQSIGDLKTVAKSTYNRLLQVSQSEDSDELYDLAQALGNIGRHTNSTEETLLKLANHPEHMVRYSAVDALGTLENTSVRVVAALLALLNDEDIAVYSRARDVLIQLGKRFPIVVIPSTTQHIEQQPSCISAGYAIDALWSIIVE